MRPGSRLPNLLDYDEKGQPKYLTAQKHAIKQVRAAAGVNKSEGFDEDSDDDDDPFYVKRSRVRMDHRHDELRATISQAALEQLETLADQDLIKLAINKVISKTLGDQNVKVTPILDAGLATALPRGNDDHVPRSSRSTFELPTIFNGPVMLRERRQLVERALRQLLIYGFVVVGIDADLMNRSFKAVKQELKSDPRMMRAPKFRDQQATIPCQVMAAEHFEVRAYRCAKNTEKIEWRVLAVSADAKSLKAKGWRFAVYMPQDALIQLHPQVRASGMVSLNSPVHACRKPYLRFLDDMSKFNAVVTQNSLQKFVYATEAKPLSPDEMSEIQRLQSQRQAHSAASQQQAWRGTPGSATYRLPGTFSSPTPTGELAFSNNVQLSLPPIVRAQDAISIMDIALRRQAKGLNAETTHTGSHPFLETGNGRADASYLDPLPSNGMGKTFDTESLEWAKQREFASRVTPLDAQKVIDRSSATLPYNCTLQAHIPATYTGLPIETINLKFEQAVAMAFSTTRMLMGFDDAKVASASSKVGKGPDVVRADKKELTDFAALCRKELQCFFEWVYQEIICWFDKRLLVDVIKRENEKLGITHDKLVQYVQEFESLEMQQEQENPERTLYDEEEFEERHAPRRETQENAPDYKLSREEMALLQRKLNFSLESYRQMSIYLVYLTMCLHGTARLTIQWEKRT